MTVQTTEEKSLPIEDRLRNALATEEDYLLRLLEADNLMRGDIQGAFQRVYDLLEGDDD